MARYVDAARAHLCCGVFMCTCTLMYARSLAGAAAGHCEAWLQVPSNASIIRLLYRAPRYSLAAQLAIQQQLGKFMPRSAATWIGLISRRAIHAHPAMGRRVLLRVDAGGRGCVRAAATRRP